MFNRLAKKLMDLPQYSDLLPILAYLGTLDPTCGGAIRDRVKELFAAFTADPVRSEQSETLLAHLVSQVGADFEAKAKDFNAFNLGKFFDPRGLQTLAHTAVFLGEDGRYVWDTQAFDDELVLMESFFQFAGLTTDDVSTFPDHPMLGIYHVRIGDLESDEQYFLGLANALQAFDPVFSKFMKGSCSTIQAAARFAAPRLPMPGVFASGVLFKNGF
jgi:hypothetical protein